MGGNDIIDGGAGTDQLNLLNLSNLLIIGSSYTNPGGDISGRISLTNVEQINFVSASGMQKPLVWPDRVRRRVLVVLVGTSGNDTLSLFPMVLLRQICRGHLSLTSMETGLA